MNSTDTLSPAKTEIEEVAGRIAEAARPMSARIEEHRRLPEELVAALHDSGLLRAGAPAEVDALELPPGTALRCAETLAAADASVGWCVSIAITASLLVGYLPETSRDELFGNGRGVAAGVWAPRGTARSVDGGVVVSGRWAFCSGISHADVMFTPSIATRGPYTRTASTARPASRSKLHSPSGYAMPECFVMQGRLR